VILQLRVAAPADVFQKLNLPHISIPHSTSAFASKHFDQAELNTGWRKTHVMLVTNDLKAASLLQNTHVVPIALAANFLTSLTARGARFLKVTPYSLLWRLMVTSRVMNSVTFLSLAILSASTVL
jgi:hypothetical protein